MDSPSTGRRWRATAAWVAAPALAGLLFAELLAFWSPLAREGLTGPSMGYAFGAAASFLPFLIGAIGLRIVIWSLRGWWSRRRGDPRASSGASFAALAYVWDTAWLVTAQGVLTTTYSWTKLFLPAYGGTPWDGRFAALDSTLALGVNPNVVLLTIFAEGPQWAARFLDVYYAAFVLTMLAGTAWFLSDPRRERRLLFGWGIAAVWSLGLAGYLAFPALGPAFTVEGLHREIAAVFPIAARTQAWLLLTRGRVLAALDNPGVSVLVAPELGLAAMPSLHVAAHAFLALWAWRRDPVLRTPFLVMVLLTFLGSVATGWHYVVDSWAGLGIAAAVYGFGAVARRLAIAK